MIKEASHKNIIHSKFREVISASKKIKTLFLLILSLFAVGTLGYMFLEGKSFPLALLATLETLTFSHQTTTTLLGRIFQLILLLFGVVILWFAIETSLSLMLEGKFENYFQKVDMMKQIKKIKNHYLICGAGRVGMYLAEALKKKGEKYLIIDRNPILVAEMHKRGLLAFEGDVMDEDTLLSTGLMQAKGLVAVLPETENNILIVLTVREHRPDIKIFARAEKRDLIKKLKKAGADYIVMPEYIGAEDILNEIKKS